MLGMPTSYKTLSAPARQEILICNVVVFCTDAEAEERAKAMGVATIFNAQLFGTSVPKEAAELFGDEAFVAIVYAKLIIAHLVSSLGFSFLLQDVDVVWCADNPMSYFQRDVDLLKNYDMLVQDDGGRTPNYAPYYANSGFYFAKSNEKTKYFFHQLLYNGDKMHDWSSDQAVFNALLPEVVNLAGMSVKTLASDDFAGGRMYQDPDSYDYMREMLTNALCISYALD
jgi:lipopolysaccharide biosynthesis glycosyltransferase